MTYPDNYGVEVSYDDAVGILKQIVNERGFDARPDASGDSACIYMAQKGYRLQAVCLIGVAFSYLGILRALIRSESLHGFSQPSQFSSCDFNSDMWDRAAAMGVTFSGDARRLFKAAQEAQDGGYVWGKALHMAVDSFHSAKVAEAEDERERALANLPTDPDDDDPFN